MMGAAAMAVNVTHGLGETSAGFALSYAAIRFLLVIEYTRVWHRIPSTRPLTKRYAIDFAVSATIWTVSAFVPPPQRFILWGVGMTIDFLTPLLIGKLAIKFAPHTSHLPERMGLFVIIVLGESILGIVAGLAGHEWNVYSTLSVGLGLSIPFSLWWIYFDRTYQQFVDRNLELKKREDELQHSVNELEAKKTELQEATTDSNQHVTEFQETNADLEMEQEIVMLMNDLSTPPPNIANRYH